MSQSRYDSALTIFSPDGHLFQVEYAMEAVRMGTSVVGVRGKSCVVLGVEKKAAAKLQDTRTVKKIVKLDDHIMIAFAGLKADARVLIQEAQLTCQQHRYSIEDAPTVEYVARSIAALQQKYTQRGGVRPFGVASLIAGFDTDGKPQLFKTEPSGAYSSWKAACTGKGDKTIREYLEKSYEPDLDNEKAIKLAVCALLDIVEGGSKSIEIVVLTADAPAENLSEEKLDEIAKIIEKEKEEEVKRRREEA